MLIGVIADDFTGASDIANTLAKGLPGQGGVTSQYMGVPDSAAAPEVEAGVVSLKSPLDPGRRMRSRSRWRRLPGCRPRDAGSSSSSTARPSTRPLRATSARSGRPWRTRSASRASSPAPPSRRWAALSIRGICSSDDRLLSESGMENHPLTPMTDADIRRWLRRQTAFRGRPRPGPGVRAAGDRRGAARLRDAARPWSIVDAVTDDDLVRIGRACADAPLLTGGSGIALGLPANFIAKGLAEGGRTRFEGVAGPEAILAGSCSGRRGPRWTPTGACIRRWRSPSRT